MFAGAVFANQDLYEYIQAFAPEHRDRLRSSLHWIPSRAMSTRIRRWRDGSNAHCCYRCDVSAATGDDADFVFAALSFEACALILNGG